MSLTILTIWNTEIILTMFMFINQQRSQPRIAEAKARLGKHAKVWSSKMDYCLAKSTNSRAEL